jgi:hypothetical protein
MGNARQGILGYEVRPMKTYGGRGWEGEAVFEVVGVRMSEIYYWYTIQRHLTWDKRWQ